MPEITGDMISYGTNGEDTHIVTVDGVPYQIEFELDHDSNPADADCFSPEDITAWERDEWHYIGVIVTPLDVPDKVQFDLSDSLWGLEFGFPVAHPLQEHNGRTYRYTDADYQICVYPVPDMIDEVAAKVAAYDDGINRLAGFKVR